MGIRHSLLPDSCLAQLCYTDVIQGSNKRKVYTQHRLAPGLHATNEANNIDTYPYEHIYYATFTQLHLTLTMVVQSVLSFYRTTFLCHISAPCTAPHIMCTQPCTQSPVLGQPTLSSNAAQARPHDDSIYIYKHLVLSIHVTPSCIACEGNPHGCR